MKETWVFASQEVAQHFMEHLARVDKVRATITHKGDRYYVEYETRKAKGGAQ